MSFENEWKKVDASRVRGVAVARVQQSGRLNFDKVAQKLLGIGCGHIEIYESQSGNGDLAARVLNVGEKKDGAFEVKKSGVYLYLSFRQFLQERGVDFVNQEVSYEVTRMNEEIDGHGVFKLTRKIAPRVSSVQRRRRSVSSTIYKSVDTEE